MFSSPEQLCILLFPPSHPRESTRNGPMSMGCPSACKITTTFASGQGLELLLAEPWGFMTPRLPGRAVPGRISHFTRQGLSLPVIYATRVSLLLFLPRSPRANGFHTAAGTLGMTTKIERLCLSISPLRLLSGDGGCGTVATSILLAL